MPRQQPKRQARPSRSCWRTPVRSSCSGFLQGFLQQVAPAWRAATGHIQ
jgi:hypothetical protein